MKILEEDIDKINGLTFNSNLTPSFEAIKWCLCWPDEHVPDIGIDGREAIYELWMIRSLIHRDQLLDSRQTRFWNWALEALPNWPGFQRITLTENERSYFSEMMEDGGL